MDALNKVLAQQIQGADVTAFQLQQYLSHRITPLPSPGTTTEWTTLACPMFCTSWIVNVAQRGGQLSRRSRGCGVWGSVLRFPLPHTPL